MLPEHSNYLILGGGFAGVRAALDLGRLAPRGATITLVADKPHFEYYPGLYRILGGQPPSEVCVSFTTLFSGSAARRRVRTVEATVQAVDLNARQVTLTSGAVLSYDSVLLALGSQPSYFNIPGLAEHSHSFKSTADALALRKHLDTVFSRLPGTAKEDKTALASIVVVGGGPSGVEVAGELGTLTACLAKKYGVPPDLVSITLIEASPRVLPSLLPKVSGQVEARLRELGVNVFVNRVLQKQADDTLYLQDMELQAGTVVWTAGVKPHALYAVTAGLTFDPRGRVLVNERLQAANHPNVYVVGDGAAVPFTGTAQTAIAGGRHAARAMAGLPVRPFGPRAPVPAIPIGRGWASTTLGGRYVFSGWLGWLIRRAADLDFFLSILPPLQAWRVFWPGARPASVCATCAATTDSAFS